MTHSANNLQSRFYNSIFDCSYCWILCIDLKLLNCFTSDTLDNWSFWHITLWTVMTSLDSLCFWPIWRFWRLWWFWNFYIFCCAGIGLNYWAVPFSIFFGTPNTTLCDTCRRKYYWNNAIHFIWHFLYFYILLGSHQRGIWYFLR